MASIKEIVRRKIPKYEQERRLQYMEYLKAQCGKGDVLSYKEWRRECRIHGPNKNPQLFSLPSIKTTETDHTSELPRC